MILPCFLGWNLLDFGVAVTYKPVGMVVKRKGDKTRRALLEAAFEVICRKGFQTAGLNEILELAGLTKGAVYHHFRGKTALGYAVVEEIVGELIAQRWISPLSAEGDRLTVIGKAMRGAAEGMDEGDIARGCPLGNLAAEMSALDEGFAKRIDAIYQRWRDALSAALPAGDDDPERIATFIVATLAGCLAQAKVLARRDILLDGITELEFYLYQLRTGGAEPPAVKRTAKPRAAKPVAKPPESAPKPEPEPEPESRYAPPPPEMEDFLL